MRPWNQRLPPAEHRRDAWIGQVKRALLLLVLVGLVGVGGYYTIWLAYSPDPASHSILDSFYLTVITLTTVGYGDNLELLDLPEPGKTVGTIFSVVYILVAYGVVLWTSALIIAYVVEGSLSDEIFRRRQRRKARMLEHHFILCGIGRTGAEIAAEFKKTGIPLVIIDPDTSQLELAGVELDENVAVLEGEATSEEILQEAGILRARGLIANLESDPENLFLTMTARALNPNLRIVTGAVEQQNRAKLIRAGADSVVYPWQIGAMRLASEMIRPTVVSFLDRMLRDPERMIRVSEVDVEQGSELAGKSIKTTAIHKKTGLLVVAVHEPGSPPDSFVYNPSGNHVIHADATLVVIGDSSQIEVLDRMAKA